MTILPSVFARRALVVRRRARRDAAQLATLVAMVAIATVLGILGPGLVLDTLDEGAQYTVRAAGSRVDLVVGTNVGEPVDGVALTTPEQLIDLGSSIPIALPSDLSAVFASSTVTALSGETGVHALDGEEWTGERLVVRIAMLSDGNSHGLTLVDGRLPASRASDDLGPVEVVLSQESARILGAAVGTELSLGVPQRTATPESPVAVPVLRVVGIAVDAAEPDSGTWEDTPELWSPLQRAAQGASNAYTRFTVLAAPDGVTTAARYLDYPFRGTVRLRLDASRFTAQLASDLPTEVKGLAVNAQPLIGDSGLAVSVQSELPEALADFPLLARAALAQMSVMMAGVIGIAGVVLVLLSRLLIAQRAGAIALERARGASVLSVGLRTLIESAVVTAAGVLIGLGIGRVVIPIGLGDLLAVAVVALVAALAAPVQAMVLARQLWAGRREPANRRDRQLRERRSSAQRLVLELAVVVLAVAALVSLRGRGLLQNRTSGIDPLLALAPLLLAVAVTIVVIRVYPFPVRAIGLAGRRTRGALGLLGAVRARSAVAALPLLALTLGASLAVSGVLLVGTVHDGQDEAAWQRVGAQARVSAELSDAQVTALRSAPGVDAVSATISRGGIGLDLGTTSTTVTVIAIDGSYPDVVDALPGAPSSASLRELENAPTTRDAVSVVLDPQSARRLVSDDFVMYYGAGYVRLHVVGTTEVAPDGYIEGPYAYVDLAALAARMPVEPVPGGPAPTVERADAPPADTYLVVGPGADAAVARLAVPNGAVLTRSGWIQERRDMGLVSGVQRTMVFAIAAVGVLAVVALVATVLGGARARGRALSLLRTLGMRPRLGWWLALAELAPLVVAAVLGGIAAGVTVVLALEPSLGLDVLAGGTTIPAPSLSPLVLYGIVAASLVLLLLGALADVLVHRRDKLSEVLRLGETV